MIDNTTKRDIFSDRFCAVCTHKKLQTNEILGFVFL